MYDQQQQQQQQQQHQYECLKMKKKKNNLPLVRIEPRTPTASNQCEKKLKKLKKLSFFEHQKKWQKYIRTSEIQKFWGT